MPTLPESNRSKSAEKISKPAFGIILTLLRDFGCITCIEYDNDGDNETLFAQDLPSCLPICFEEKSQKTSSTFSSAFHHTNVFSVRFDRVTRSNGAPLKLGSGAGVSASSNLGPWSVSAAILTQLPSGTVTVIQCTHDTINLSLRSSSTRSPHINSTSSAADGLHCGLAMVRGSAASAHRDR